MKDRKNYYRCCGNCQNYINKTENGFLTGRILNEYEYCTMKHIVITRGRIKALFCTKYIDNRGDQE